MTIIDSLARACDRFDEVRSCLRWAGSLSASNSEAEHRAGRELRASSFVAITGAIEQFFREFVHWLTNGIHDSGVTNNDLRLSLHAIVGSDDFRSLQSLRDSERMFERRATLLERTEKAGVSNVAPRSDEMGLAGETIRPAQVNTVWRIYGLPAPGFETLAQQLAMRVFADNRNDFAHGKVAVEEFLRNPECQAPRILSRLGDLEAWCFHCWSCGDVYLANQLFRR